MIPLARNRSHFLIFKDVALNNIANALREGKHLVIGSRAVLAKLIDCNFLSSKSTATYFAKH